jgi:hypothetical protein
MPENSAATIHPDGSSPQREFLPPAVQAAETRAEAKGRSLCLSDSPGMNAWATEKFGDRQAQHNVNRGGGSGNPQRSVLHKLRLLVARAPRAKCAVCKSIPRHPLGDEYVAQRLRPASCPQPTSCPLLPTASSAGRLLLAVGWPRFPACSSAHAASRRRHWPCGFVAARRHTCRCAA